MKKPVLFTVILLSAVLFSANAQTVKQSWNFGFGFSYPRFHGSDLRPQESNFGGYISLQRYFSEKVSLRIKGSYLSLEGRIAGSAYRYTNGTIVPSLAEFARVNLLTGNFDILYNLSPCSSVSPYLGLGIGAASFNPDWPDDVVNPEAESGVAAQLNIVFGAEVRLSERWKLVTDFEFHTIASQVDGIINNNRQGIFGSNSDSYINANLGFQYYFALGEPSAYCGLYDGLSVKVEEQDYPTIEEIEDVIKKYSTEPAEVDYDRIESMIKKYRSSGTVGGNWVLYGVNFALGKSSLSPEAYPILEHAAEVLRANPDLRVEIQGHTDNIGSDESNMILSNARAEVVKDFLVKNGVNASRLTIKAFGESKPVADNNTEQGRARNRRVEFKVSTE